MGARVDEAVAGVVEGDAVRGSEDEGVTDGVHPLSHTAQATAITRACTRLTLFTIEFLLLR